MQVGSLKWQSCTNAGIEIVTFIWTIYWYESKVPSELKTNI